MLRDHRDVVPKVLDIDSWQDSTIYPDNAFGWFVETLKEASDRRFSRPGRTAGRMEGRGGAYEWAETERSARGVQTERRQKSLYLCTTTHPTMPTHSPGLTSKLTFCRTGAFGRVG